MLPLKLLCYNTYLIGKYVNQNRETYPSQRARSIKTFLQQGGYDLCFLQEVWGAGLSCLVEVPFPNAKIYSRKQWRLPMYRNAFLNHLPNGFADWFYTMHFFLLGTGGLYDIAMADMNCVYRQKHTFSRSRSRSRKGVEATLWTDIAAWDKTYDLLVFNTHLDPWHPANRRCQVEEIEDFAYQTVQKIQDLRPHQSWEKTAILVVGDFNVKAQEGSINEETSNTTEEYDSLFKRRGWKDYFETEPLSSQTYALQNRLVTCPQDCGRIDYIFGISSLKGFQFLPLKCVSKSIVRRDDGVEPSDHYPLSVDLLPAHPSGKAGVADFAESQ